MFPGPATQFVHIETGQVGADIICDITSSGVTLRENRLKAIAGGVVVESQACLIGNRRGLTSDPQRLEATRGLLELIEAYLRSRQQVSLRTSWSRLVV